MLIELDNEQVAWLVGVVLATDPIGKRDSRLHEKVLRKLRAALDPETRERIFGDRT